MFVDEEQRKTARQGRVFKNREGKEIGSRRDVTCSGKNTRTRGVSNGSWFKNQDCTILQQRSQKDCLTRQGIQSGDCCPTKRRGSGGGEGEGTYLVIYTVQERERDKRERCDGNQEKQETVRERVMTRVIIIVVIDGDGMEGMKRRKGCEDRGQPNNRKKKKRGRKM